MYIDQISYRKNLSSKSKRDFTLSLINNSDADLLLFPGHTVTDSADLAYISEHLENDKTTVFLELKNIGARKITNWSFKIEKGDLINCSTHQLFSSSKEIANNLFCAENLLNEIKLKRIHKVKNKKICLLICGELNILTNIQSQNNRVEIRFDSDDIKKKYADTFSDIDVFINPIHTPMGNQGKMSKRREFLSDNGRAYFSTANLSKPAGEAADAFIKSKAVQYAYYDGHDIEHLFCESNKDYMIKNMK